MNRIWEGLRLRDILLRASFRYDKAKDQKRYQVQFESHSQKTLEEDWYGGSIPLDRALAEDKDVLSAVKVGSAYSWMAGSNVRLLRRPPSQLNCNGLPERHGYPLRVIVPGVLGARSVK